MKTKLYFGRDVLVRSRTSLRNAEGCIRPKVGVVKFDLVSAHKSWTETSGSKRMPFVFPVVDSPK